MPRPHKNTSYAVIPRTNKNTSPAVIQKPVDVPVINARPSLGQTMKEGFGLGVGVSLGQHAVNGVMNFLTPPKSSNPVENKDFEPTRFAKQNEYAQNKDFEPTRFAKQIEYEKCMKYSSNDSNLCETLLNN
jgi:hypothetical protein